MNDYCNLILEKQKKRFEVLFAIYKDTNGEEDKLAELGELRDATGIPIEELVHILKYLENEGLVKPLATLFSGAGIVPIKILHQGVLEVEAAITKPRDPTEHFPAQLFNITNNAPVSTQQLGNQNTVNLASAEEFS
jgi:hypothetical protein